MNKDEKYPAAPRPWTYRKAKYHFKVRAANGLLVAEVRYVKRPDGSTSEDQAALICRAVNDTLEAA